LGAATNERRLVAILAADVVGYSRMVGADETGTLARLRTLRREVVEPLVAESGGRVFKTTGDGLLAEFPSTVQALRCAIGVQELLRADGLQLRIGVHQGDVVVEGDDLLGDGVNVAARLEGLAEPGGICISGRVHEDAAGKIALDVEDLGEPELKNIAQRHRVFRVRLGEPERPVLPLPEKPSIAVLPFQNMSDDPEQEYFADGIVEDIITALSRFRQLFVIARNSSFAYKGKALDLRQVGRELGVRYVLEGSVRKGSNRVRVTTQLIDAASGTHLWAERYDRELSDVFAVQDEITASVAGVIEPALAEAEQQRVLRKPPERLDAWEAYQRGLWHFYKYGPDENRTAQTFFRRAIELDPKFAPGHYGYAFALQWDIWHYSGRPFSEAQGIPRTEARLAVSLDDKDAMAHAVFAHMLMWGSEWEAAIAEARSAFALNPNSAFVISMLGCVLGFGGYPAEALDRLRQAMRASPHDPLTWLWTQWIATIQLCARDFAAALETARRVTHLRPGCTPAYNLIALSLAHLGRVEEARATLDRAEEEFGENFRRYAQRPPWLRPEDYVVRVEGLRLMELQE
jgi:adenylate cyclase